MNYEFGSFPRRAVALILDCLLLLVAVGLIVNVLWNTFGSPIVFDYDETRLTLWDIIIFWLYEACFLSSSWKATPGKRAMGLIVLNENSYHKISFLHATGRHFASYVSTLLLGFGYLVALFTKRNQTLHDKLAGTVVVRKSSVTQMQQSFS